ncbi:sugar O-acetyltransferase [Marinilabiliaceae bacterium ANBcel2]|nr:sugar O-acetyltransferase [Marinilabiliaceae bacterium ANBcel2]
MTEKEKMLNGELYDATDKVLENDRNIARKLTRQLNFSDEKEKQLRVRTLQQLMPNSSKSSWIQPPFHCDYGYNIILGKDVFLNFNCIILDIMSVKIGDRTLIGPNVQIYAATHPMDYKTRKKGLEAGKPVTIGQDVWIGGSAVICPGVTIGNRSVIGAGSIVTRDIPEDVLAAGNPCKIIKKL